MQSPQAAHDLVAAYLALPPENVTVNVTLLGGSFGRKSKPDFAGELVLEGDGRGAGQGRVNSRGRYPQRLFSYRVGRTSRGRAGSGRPRRRHGNTTVSRRQILACSSTIRSTGRLSGRGRRGGRGFCARFCLAASGAAISALVSCSAWVSSRSSMASSSCSLPRSEDCPTARDVPWPASASAVRFPGGRRWLRSSPRQQFSLRKDHRVRSGKVGGKRIGGRRHADKSTIFVAKNPAGFPS